MPSAKININTPANPLLNLKERFKIHYRNINVPKNQSGFTLIEIIVVLLIVGILATSLLPRVVNLGSAARISVLKSYSGAVQSSNTLVIAKVRTGTGAQAVLNRDDLLDIDMDDDGTYETRLKWEYLDNTDIEIWIPPADALSIQYTGIDKTYIGFDENTDGDVINDDCYFLYTQASSATNPPGYAVVSSGC